MEPSARPKRRWPILVFAALVLVALWGVLGGLVLPALAKHLIAQHATEELGRPVTVERVSVNPYTLDASVEGLRIVDADGTTSLVTVDRVDADASYASLYQWAPVIDRLTVTGLKAHLVRDAENHYNLSDILGRLQARMKARAARARGEAVGTKEAPPRFSVSNIRLVNGSVDFDDRPVGRRHEVTEILVSIPFLSTLPRHLKEYVAPSFAAKVNGAPVLLTGETMPFEDTLRTHFTLDVNALDVRKYLAYVPLPIPAKVDSGSLDAHVTVRFTQSVGKAPSVDVAGTAALSDVAVTGDSGKLLRFARLETELASFDPLVGKARVAVVKLVGADALGEDLTVGAFEANGIDVDLHDRSAHVASIATQKGRVNLRRARDGSFELPRIATTAPDPAQPPSAPWRVAIDRATLANYQVVLADAAVQPAAKHQVTLQSVEATGLTNEGGFRGQAVAKLGLERGGSLDVDTTFALEPLQVEAKVDARNVDLVGLRPYVTQFATVSLKSAAASARGEITMKGERVAYKGTAEVARFHAYDTVGREDLLKFQAIRSSGIDFAWAPDAPLALAVGDIVVDRVYSRLVVRPDGKLNVQQLRTATADEPEAPAQANPEPRPRNVRIDRITFVDGRLDFTDHFVRPNYSADVGDLRGAVTGLSSAPESRANVDLKGRYDGTSPVTIAGTVNPLRGDLFADIAAKGQDIELPKLTAYAMRYAGYGIKEGRLTLDVKYHIEEGKLEGRNNITLDQLTFGDKVESPDAVQLPVLFAVNLLKDENGRIALELPISGSLDDPKFEVGAVIAQVLGNLLKKAVTAPFSLLAAAFGGGGGTAGAAAAGNGSGAAPDDLAFVEFKPGHADLDAASLRKLQTMARALQGRPGLTLVMSPRMDAERDLAALRWQALQEMLKVDGKVPADDAYPTAVRKAYAKAKLPGDPKELSVAAMETALMEKTPVGDAELAALREQRARNVREWLVGEGKLPAERLVLAAADGSGTPAQASRVDFALK